ncbi:MULTISPECIES: NAD(P)/FAD-dependent oxidoreductase [Pelosinus]|uniref:FAD dependent oxidoreductase n=1 Tax=Pelosinus fermentans B4 TaxID=1149862 RepID=I8RK62_9FIRM|nr:MULTISPECIES: FAD-binding oxidoreductase [Pelosinus]EIW20513.1 FAD dependent oxidoreductase [Pelosinus fermentans B4]EIW25772.1 FAD dependent oxidoreductase [Pelosinus fermentans A11]OAM93496.1 FAD dependent oxidoreductase [Pelosinus fermentans DSM 17108]SDQ79846.1 sarcosine oxidase subunit beta [Pelosinus fermentans]
MIKNADVVVIGGGVIGCSTAYNLAKLGAGKVVVLEKNYLASGATGRCGAGMRMQWGTETNCLLSRESVKMLSHLPELLNVDVDIEFTQNGYLMPAYSEKMAEQFKKNLVLQNSLNIPARWVTPEESLEIVPFLNTKGMFGATYCAEDGHCNPFKVTEAYAQAAKNLNVEIYTDTEVQGIITKNGKIISVRTNQGNIQTDTVVNAAGGYAKTVGRMVGVELPIFPERHEILVTEPVEPTMGPMVMSFYHNLYCQQSPHGSFIMGIGHPNEPESYNIKSSWQFLRDMAERLVEILPPLAGLNVVRQWAGLYDMCPDRTPILGSSPALNRFFTAAGFSGHGFMISPITGQLMAEMVVGKPTAFPIQMFDAGRFDRGELFIEPSVV